MEGKRSREKLTKPQQGADGSKAGTTTSDTYQGQSHFLEQVNMAMRKFVSLLPAQIAPQIHFCVQESQMWVEFEELMKDSIFEGL